MSINIHVTELSSAEAAKLSRLLGEKNFEFKSVPHATFSAKGEDVNVTHYKSGKFVVQGRGTKMFVALYLGEEARPKETAQASLEQPVIGTDESGKGDYFGPLVVAACLVRPEDLPLLEELGVTDSKKASDRKILAAETKLKKELPHAVISLMPERYNVDYQQIGNLNVLLGNMHAEVIERVLEQTPTCRKAISDKFGDERYIKRALGEAGRDINLVQETRAEVHPPVAAASFLARAAFLAGIDALEEKATCRLPRGASSAVEDAAREIVRFQGEEALSRFAKVHFRITERVVPGASS